MSLKARLLIAVITLVILNVLIMGIGSVNIAVSRATEAQLDSTQASLQSQTFQTRQLLEDYFSVVAAQVRSKSYDLSTVEAARAFVSGFNGYARVRGDLSEGEWSDLQGYYQGPFADKYTA